MLIHTMNAKRVWFLSIFVGIASSGCAVIVGADGYSVDKGSTGTGGGTGGTGGGTTGGSTGSGGTMGKGGGPPADAGRDGPLPMGAGETLCMGNTCPAGQSCLVTAFSPPGLCTYSCDTLTCDADHDCVHSNRVADMFPNSCVKK